MILFNLLIFLIPYFIIRSKCIEPNIWRIYFYLFQYVPCFRISWLKCLYTFFIIIVFKHQPIIFRYSSWQESNNETSNHWLYFFIGIQTHFLFSHFIVCAWTAYVSLLFKLLDSLLSTLNYLILNPTALKSILFNWLWT